ncbi:MAG TPA: 50S ribosomal protein L32e [Methanoregula sp.]|nr:50S ribosomal protein L32e [Methanoregula sp.]
MTSEVKRLIQVRTDKGARFKRDGYGKKRQLSDSWRKPRGQHNKQREQKKAKGALPKPGYGSPVAIRGMHPSGFFEILVASEKELDGINPKTQAVRISATVGERKRTSLQEKALGAGLKVLNPRVATAEQKAKKPAKPVVSEEKGPKKEEKKPLKAKLSAALAPKKETKKEKPAGAEKNVTAKPAKKAEKPKAEKTSAKKSDKPAEKAAAKAPAKSAAKAEKAAPAKKAEPARGKPKTEAKAKPKSAKKTGSGVKKND